MRKAIKYKLNIVNDVSGFSYDNQTIKFLKDTNLPLVINHSKGDPETMQKKPSYENVLLEIYDFFVKKHVKTKKEKKGGIVSKENFIHLSNLAIFDTKNKNEAKK